MYIYTYIYMYLLVQTIHNTQYTIHGVYIKMKTKENYSLFAILPMGGDNSVGIATRYGLGGLGIESRCGRDFSTPVQTGPVAHPASYTMGNGSVSRG
jgi:hypothetical protein